MTTYEAARFEQLLKDDPWFAEMYAKMPPWPKERGKPKPGLVLVVSDAVAAAARANPDGVRVSVRAEDGTVVVDRPRRVTVSDDGVGAMIAVKGIGK